MNWIFITGTSTGLGEECCKHFLDQGFGVFATLRNRTQLPQWILGLEEPKRKNLHIIELDLNNMQGLSLAIEEVAEVLNQKNDQLHALVNNAGICITGPLELLGEDQLLGQMKVNWLGPILLTQRLLPLLRKSRGTIINVGSAAGSIALPFLSAYASSKFAMEAWSDSLRRELLPQGVKVVLLQVGSISTPIWQKLEDNANAHLLNASEDQVLLYNEAVKNFLKINGGEVNKRKTHPRDVAHAIVSVLGKKTPPTRVRIGGDAWLTFIVTKILPDKILDFFLCHLTNIKDQSHGNTSSSRS